MPFHSQKSECFKILPIIYFLYKPKDQIDKISILQTLGILWSPLYWKMNAHCQFFLYHTLSYQERIPTLVIFALPVSSSMEARLALFHLYVTLCLKHPESYNLTNNFLLPTFLVSIFDHLYIMTKLFSLLILIPSLGNILNTVKHSQNIHCLATVLFSDDILSSMYAQIYYTDSSLTR